MVPIFLLFYLDSGDKVIDVMNDIKVTLLFIFVRRVLKFIFWIESYEQLIC